MPANPYATSLAARLKSDLRHDIPRSMLGSVHLTEAIAAGLGYSSHAALLTAHNVNLEAALAAGGLADFASRALERLRQLRPDVTSPQVEDAFLVAAAVIEDEMAKRVPRHDRASPGPKTLEDLQAYGALSSEMVGFLRIAIMEHRHILLSGRSGSYVGMLMTALVNAVPAAERIVLSHEGPDLFALESRRVLRAKTYDIGREWLLMSHFDKAEGRNAMRGCGKAMGVILRAPGFLPSDPEQLVFDLKSMHEDGAPPAIDLILRLSKPNRTEPARWVQSCWSVAPDWSSTLVAKDGQVLTVAGSKPRY